MTDHFLRQPQQRIMTPYIIGVLLHYHVSAEDFKPLPGDTIFAATIAQLIDDEYLTQNDTGTGQKYRRTAKLTLYCAALCAMPEPVRGWVMP